MILLNFLLSYENLLSFVKLMNINEGDVKGLGRKVWVELLHDKACHLRQMIFFFPC